MSVAQVSEQIKDIDGYDLGDVGRVLMAPFLPSDSLPNAADTVGQRLLRQRMGKDRLPRRLSTIPARFKSARSLRI